jgi:hypothetical protein
MTTLEKAARLALDAMRQVHPDLVCDAFSHNRRTDQHGYEDVCPITVRWNAAIAALDAALAQQQAEPVVEPDEIYKAVPLKAVRTGVVTWDKQAEPVVERAALFNELGERMFGTVKLSGCAVCGIGAGKVMGYVCPRGNCPTKVTCGGAV